jgi:hypothetical protein
MIMLIPENSNLQDLLSKYRYNQRSEAGYLLLSDFLNSDVNFRQMLIGFVELDDEEGTLDASEALNAILDFLSILYIAILINYVPEELPEDLRAELDKMLIPQVIDYCLENNRLLPVQFFNKISEGTVNENEYDEDVLPLFIQFLNLVDKATEEEQLVAFLAEDIDVRTTVVKEVLKSPELLEQVLNQKYDKVFNENTYLLIEGYFHYLDFLEQLSELLSECEERPEIEQLFMGFLLHIFQKEDFDKLQDFLAEIGQRYNSLMTSDPAFEVFLTDLQDTRLFALHLKRIKEAIERAAVDQGIFA